MKKIHWIIYFDQKNNMKNFDFEFRTKCSAHKNHSNKKKEEKFKSQKFVIHFSIFPQFDKSETSDAILFLAIGNIISTNCIYTPHTHTLLSVAFACACLLVCLVFCLLLISIQIRIQFFCVINFGHFPFRLQNFQTFCKKNQCKS